MESSSEYDSDSLMEIQKMEDEDKRVRHLLKTKAGDINAARESAVKRRNERTKQRIAEQANRREREFQNRRKQTGEENRIASLLRSKREEIKQSREDAIKKRENNIRKRMEEQAARRAKILEDRRQLEALQVEVQELNEAAAWGKVNVSV
ncbi:beta-mannosyltransferase 2-like [Pecten maximus]|uniref:beta-mannosyltransferase 2-like n=1 Tax=Pecten maximus TaxID=6579 RepID=UPI0014580B2E|nr:beta-mannosyltransferase 2-like [Pecten maximus]